MSVCFTHPGGSYVQKRGERFDVALGLRVINYVWRHRDLERACVRGIHVYVGCVCVLRSTTWENAGKKARQLSMCFCL